MKHSVIIKKISFKNRKDKNYTRQNKNDEKTHRYYDKTPTANKRT